MVGYHEIKMRQNPPKESSTWNSLLKDNHPNHRSSLPHHQNHFSTLMCLPLMPTDQVFVKGGVLIPSSQKSINFLHLDVHRSYVAVSWWRHIAQKMGKMDNEKKNLKPQNTPISFPLPPLRLLTDAKTKSFSMATARSAVDLTPNT